MAKIDETRPFKPVHIAVMTVSDSRTEANDTSGQALVDLIARDGHVLKARTIVKDEGTAIVARLKAWIADPEIDVVISTGGTGVTGRDVTPEAFESVFEKKIDWLRRALPLALVSEDRHIDDPVARQPVASPMRPISSPCPARPAPRATAGKRS